MWLLKKFLLLVLLLPVGLVSGCAFDVNPKPQSSTIYYLPRNMYVVQTQDQRWSSENYYLIPVPKKTIEWKQTYSNLFHHQIPDLEDYEDSKTLWQSWQGIDGFTQSRIIGVVPVKTPYRISKATAETYMPYDVEIKLLQSSFQGVKINAEYRVLRPKKINTRSQVSPLSRPDNFFQ